jgi:hypothetical protein
MIRAQQHKSNDGRQNIQHSAFEIPHLPLSDQQPKKKWPSNQRRDHSNRQLDWRHHGSSDDVAADEKRGTEQC